MKREILNYNLFLASPGDVLIERKLVKNVVEELNLGFCSINDCHINLISWEDKAIPEIGNEPQKIINSQLLTKYEIDFVIGIFWHRLGTKTSTHSSGTVEELTYLIEKNDIKDIPTEIMIYFKNSTPTRLSEINPTQLSGVVEYKREIGKIGLYSEFESEELFSRMLRIHLIHKLNDKLKKK